jgi:alkylated DNA nucleotide flippase Atl1
MTTGIFLRIVAEVSEEDLRSGKRRVAPYWRVLRSDGALNSKYPGGVRHQATYLRKEGHQIERRKGGRAVVKDFQNHLVSL